MQMQINIQICIGKYAYANKYAYTYANGAELSGYYSHFTFDGYPFYSVSSYAWGNLTTPTTLLQYSHLDQDK